MALTRRAERLVFSQLSPEQTASSEAVAMDMSPAYVKAAKQTIPRAEEKIVQDRDLLLRWLPDLYLR